MTSQSPSAEQSDESHQEARRAVRAPTRPISDWSQVRETVLMLELAAGQVEAAMRDSNYSVEVLTDTFTSMAEYSATDRCSGRHPARHGSATAW